MLNSASERTLRRLTLTFSLCLVLVLLLMTGATGFRPSAAAGQSNEPSAPLAESGDPAPIAPAEVVADSEPPTVLVANNVASYNVPSPGLFWHQSTYCPTVIGSVPGDTEQSAQDAQAAPAALNNTPLPFSIGRMTVRGTEPRTLMFRAAPTPCVPYPIHSNIVADNSYVYFVNNAGLVRLPVTANSWDEPALFAELSHSTQPVELHIREGTIFAAVNRPPTDGPFGQLGNSRITSFNTATAEETGIYFNFGFNANYRALSSDGEFVYAIDLNSNLLRFDFSANRVTIAPNVRAYFAHGPETMCLQLQCTTTKYVFYSTGKTIRRYNNVDGANIQVQNRPGDIRTIVVAPKGYLAIFTGDSLFWFEELFTPCSPSPCFGGSYTHSLYRAGKAANSTPELLYFYTTTEATRSPAHLTSDGEFLFWLEGGGGDATLLRLPNAVGELPKVDLAITGMEITQGVQNNNNEVRLIRNRATYVRVFVRATGQNVPGVTARLYGTVNGQNLGPLVPLRQTHLTVKTNPSRIQLDDAFLFALPWEWSAHSQITLRVELNPFRIPQENNYGDNVLANQVFAFSPSQSLDIIFVEANYRIQRSLNDFTDYNVNDTGVHLSWLRRAYPLPEGGLNYRIWSINGGAQLGNRIMGTEESCKDVGNECAANWVRAKMAEMKANAGSGVGARTLMYGLIPDSSRTGGAFPRGNALGPIAAGPTGVTSIIGGGYADYGFYTGHEIGHMLGRGHPFPNSDDPATPPNKDDPPVVEGCGHSRADFDFPHFLARIGPGNTSVRGLDRARPNAGGLARPFLLNDIDSYDIMSYCGDQQLQWVSDYTWEGLYNGIQNLAAAGIAGPLMRLEGDWLGVFGVAYEENVIVYNLARMDAVTDQYAGDEGEFRLVLLDAANTELASYRFGTDEDHGSEEGLIFDLVIPFAPGTRTIQILTDADNVVRYVQTVSANPPTISDVTLIAATSPISGEVTLSWAASDADSDPLLFDVFYSENSGESWIPLAFAVTEQVLTLDTAQLAGGQGRFRVVASDGVNQASADSSDVAIAVKPPLPTILSPANGEHFNWGQLVNFSAEALDPQDGLLNDNAFTWSNQYGVLGQGSLLSTEDLPVGLNVITLRAENSAGLDATTQISITVGDDLELPGPILQVAPGALSFQFPAEATDVQTSTLALDNSGGGTMTWSAADDADFVTLDVTEGEVPAQIIISVNPAGLTALVQHNGSITIIGTPTGLHAGAPAQVIIVPVSASIGNTFDTALGSTTPPDTDPDPDDPGRIFLPQLTR